MRKLLKVAEKYLVDGFMDRINATDLMMGYVILGLLIVASYILIPHVPVLGIILLCVLLPVFLIPFFSMGVEVALKFLNRPKDLGNGNTMDGELYAAAVTRLKERGVSDAERYIREHAEHAEISSLLVGTLKDRYYGFKEYSIPSLVYTNDDSPEDTMDAILAIMEQRAIRDPEDVEELLKARSDIESPLMDGAL